MKVAKAYGIKSPRYWKKHFHNQKVTIDETEHFTQPYNPLKDSNCQ